MTNRRSKAKKSTSKPKGTTQPTSSKVKLTIPARPAAAQPVASTPVTIDPPEAYFDYFLGRANDSNRLKWKEGKTRLINMVLQVQSRMLGRYRPFSFILLVRKVT